MKHMQIAAKTALALGALFFALLIGGWIILDRAVQPSFDRLEQENHARDQARVEANLEALRRDIETRANDYAQWNDTYDYVKGQRPQFIAENFSDEWFASYGVNVMGIVDARGRILWAQASIEGVPEATGDAAVRETLAAGTPAWETQTGVIWLAGLPLMMTSTPVTTNDGTAPPRGRVILGRVLSANDLSAQVQIDTRLFNREAPAPENVTERLADFYHNRGNSWISPDRLYTLIALDDARGDAVGAVLIESKRDVHALGVDATRAALLLFAVLAALAVVGLWVLMRRIVIARIVALEQHLGAQSNESAELTPLPEDSAHDEIGRLVETYNSLAARLKSAIAREQEAVLAREAAATADRMKSDFLTNVSHELRQPLDTVIGYAELIEEELEDLKLPNGRSDVAHIIGAARQLVDLVDEIHDLSLIESGRVRVTVQSFDVQKLVSEIAAKGRELARENGNRFEYKVDDDLGQAFSDELRLQQCVTNLIAYCSTQQFGSYVALEVSRSADGANESLRFVVTPGSLSLSSAQMEHVFEPFSQAAPLTSNTQRLAAPGLGMAIARKVSGMIGGRIEATNEPGRCMRFELIVPVVAPDVRAPQVRTRERGPSSRAA